MARRAKGSILVLKSEIEQYVKYDDTSPSGLRWSVSRYNGLGNSRLLVQEDGVAGSLDRNGTRYWRVSINGQVYMGHRVVFCLHNGDLDPEMEIDHIDGDRANNTIENLRQVPAKVNLRSRAKNSRNSSGVTGVNKSHTRHFSRWVATWNDDKGRGRSKTFSVLKYGESEAFRLACEYRQSEIEKLNASGAGYSERHGA